MYSTGPSLNRIQGSGGLSHMAQCHEQYDKVTVHFSISKPENLPLNSSPDPFLQPWHVQARSKLRDSLLPVQVNHLTFVPNFQHLKRDMIPQWSPMKKFSVSSISLIKLTPKSPPVEAQLKNWTSSCYHHFKTLVIIIDKGAVKYQFICHMQVSYFHLFWWIQSWQMNRNPSILLAHKHKEDLKTNLVCHVKACEGQVVDPLKSIANYA